MTRTKTQLLWTILQCPTPFLVTAQDLGAQLEMAVRVAPMAPAAPAVIEYALVSHVVAEAAPAPLPEPGPAPAPPEPCEFPI